MVEDVFQTMNTVAQIKVEGKDEQIALAQAKAIILDFEKRFNYFSKNSEISKLCKNIHVGERYSISKELYEILLIAKKINKETNGIFDVDYLNKDKHKDYHLENGDSIIFDSPSSKINLGAIAKGFAADMAIEVIKELDVDRTLISMGGQVTCYSKDKPWRVGIQNPDEDFGQLVGSIEITNGTLSTSAENYRGDHIKNPTKQNWQSSIKSISVLNHNGTLADAYSTALFLADKNMRENLVQKNNLDVIIIDGENIFVSTLLSEKYYSLDENYKIKILED